MTSTPSPIPPLETAMANAVTREGDPDTVTARRRSELLGKAAQFVEGQGDKGISFQGLWRIAASIRALATPPADGTPTGDEQLAADLAVLVKPLRWKGTPNGRDWSAESAVGTYSVGCIGSRYIAAVRQIRDDQWVDMVISPNETSASPAKAAAQADFDQRILSCLIAGPDPRIAELEAVADAAKRLLAAVELRAVRGRQDVPAMREEQDASIGLRAALRSRNSTDGGAK